MLRPLRITCEIISSLVGIIILLGLFLFWRLSAAPAQSTFLTPTVESSIESLIPGTDVAIAHTLLAWNNADHSVTLRADGVTVKDKDGRVIASVPKFDTQISIVGLLIGQFLPKTLTVAHPEIHMDHQPDGSFTFGDVSTGKPTDKGKRSNFKDSMAQIAGDLAHAFFFRRLAIDQVVFDVHDVATGNDWSVHIPDIKLQRVGADLTGHVQAEAWQGDHSSAVEIDYTYDRSEDLHRLDAKFENIIPALLAGGKPETLGMNGAAAIGIPFTGNVGVGFDSKMSIAAANLAIHGGPGNVTDPVLWDKPRKIAAVDVKATYDRAKGTLELPEATIDFGGPLASVTGTAEFHFLSEPTDMDFKLEVTLDRWPMNQFGDLWPKTIITGARDWIATNLSQGTFDHASADITGTVDFSDINNATLKTAGGKVSASGATVHYMDGMPSVEGANATATFDMNQLTAQLTGGGIGAIRVLPFALQITGFQDDTQKISIPLKVAGPVPDIMRLIDAPPLGYTKKVGLKPGDVTGNAQGEVDFRFPLLSDLKMDDVDIVASAKLSDIASSKLAKGVNLTQGNLDLHLDTQSFSVQGPASIDGAPLTISWEQSLDTKSNKPVAQASIVGPVTADQWQALGLDVFDGSQGAIQISLQMIEPTKDKTDFSGTIDMTAAAVHVDRLNWQKKAQIPATASFKAEKADGKITISSIDMHGPQLDVKGTATLSGPDSKLTSLALDPMLVGRTDAALHFTRIEGATGALHFDAEGSSLDTSGFKSGGDEKSNDAAPPPIEFRVKIGKLWTSQNGFLSDAEGYGIRDGKGWSEISMHGMAAGSHAIDINLAMQKGGGRDLSITSDDFGAALKGLGFADTISGGSLDIRGTSDPEDPHSIVGAISIGSFSVGNLPALALLMNAASPFGFSGFLSGRMDFDSVRGGFRWDGDMLRMQGVHAAADAGIGINVGGPLDLQHNQADLHGTMVPFSGTNSVISAIPVVGDVITGGKDQGLFAVSYTIKGPVDHPKVNVNPVSLLAPGILRTLFFGSGDDEETPDEKAEKPQ